MRAVAQKYCSQAVPSSAYNHVNVGHASRICERAGRQLLADGAGPSRFRAVSAGVSTASVLTAHTFTFCRNAAGYVEFIFSTLTALLTLQLAIKNKLEIKVSYFLKGSTLHHT